MELNEEYECLHFKGKTLKVVKIYSSRLWSLSVEGRPANVLAYPGNFGEPRLMFAHVAKDQCELRRKI